MLTAGPSSASVPKPSTNSDWIRSTRHGSVCTQSVVPATVEQSLVGGRGLRGPVAADDGALDLPSIGIGLVHVVNLDRCRQQSFHTDWSMIIFTSVHRAVTG